MPSARMMIPISSPPRLLLANCSSSITPATFCAVKRLAESVAGVTLSYREDQYPGGMYSESLPITNVPYIELCCGLHVMFVHMYAYVPAPAILMVCSTTPSLGL